MICEMCNQNQATVHIIKVINGVKQELSICEKCAKTSNDIGLGGEFNMESQFTFQNILSGLVDYINQSSQNVRNLEVVCECCGTTYVEFKQKGLLGCSNCYKYFGSTIMPVIKRVQGNVEHIGKIPVKCGRELFDKKMLSNLKEQLQNAILSEEYESAAEFRDKIRELQNSEKEV